MYIAYIGGWNPIMAFSKDEETAKKLALKKKKALYKEDLEKWNWETVSEYYGAWTERIEEGSIITDL